MIEVRQLPAEQVDLLARIDRREHIDTLYEVQDGVLSSRRVSFDVPPWSTVGTGEHTIAGMVNFVRPLVESGATLLGAFVQGELVGLAVVKERFEGDMAWLALLHVSRPFRRQGVGSALWDAAVGRSQRSGARTIYVSSTPSGSAVGFYRSKGCDVPKAPHPELFAEEPEDIHLLGMIQAGRSEGEAVL